MDAETHAERQHALPCRASSSSYMTRLFRRLLRLWLFVGRVQPPGQGALACCVGSARQPNCKRMTKDTRTNNQIKRFPIFLVNFTRRYVNQDHRPKCQFEAAPFKSSQSCGMSSSCPLSLHRYIRLFPSISRWAAAASASFHHTVSLRLHLPKHPPDCVTLVNSFFTHKLRSFPQCAIVLKATGENILFKLDMMISFLLCAAAVWFCANRS